MIKNCVFSNYIYGYDSVYRIIMFGITQPHHTEEFCMKMLLKAISQFLTLAVVEFVVPVIIVAIYVAISHDMSPSIFWVTLLVQVVGAILEEALKYTLLTKTCKWWNYSTKVQALTGLLVMFCGIEFCGYVALIHYKMHLSILEAVIIRIPALVMHVTTVSMLYKKTTLLMLGFSTLIHVCFNIMLFLLQAQWITLVVNNI